MGVRSSWRTLARSKRLGMLISADTTSLAPRLMTTSYLRIEAQLPRTRNQN